MWVFIQGRPYVLRSPGCIKCHMIGFSGCLTRQSNAHGSSVAAWCPVIGKLWKIKKKRVNKNQLTFSKLNFSIQEFVENVIVFQGKMSWIFHWGESILRKQNSERVLVIRTFVFHFPLNAFSSYTCKKWDLDFCYSSGKRTSLKHILDAIRP